jgi:hypothetical protein
MLADELDYVIGVDTHRDEHVLAVVTAPAGAVRDATPAQHEGGHQHDHGKDAGERPSHGNLDPPDVDGGDSGSPAETRAAFNPGPASNQPPWVKLAPQKRSLRLMYVTGVFAYG